MAVVEEAEPASTVAEVDQVFAAVFVAGYFQDVVGSGSWVHSSTGPYFLADVYPADAY